MLTTTPPRTLVRATATRGQVGGGKSSMGPFRWNIFAQWGATPSCCQGRHLVHTSSVTLPATSLLSTSKSVVSQNTDGRRLIIFSLTSPHFSYHQLIHSLLFYPGFILTRLLHLIPVCPCKHSFQYILGLYPYNTLQHPATYWTYPTMCSIDSHIIWSNPDRRLHTSLHKCTQIVRNL